MTVKLFPFKVWFRDEKGVEREVVVFAYDLETARSRANHEGAVPSLESIIHIMKVEGFKEDCPCPKISCRRHGICEECTPHHAEKGKLPYCKR